jgi:hypothetical protein
MDGREFIASHVIVRCRKYSSRRKKLNAQICRFTSKMPESNANKARQIGAFRPKFIEIGHMSSDRFFRLMMPEIRTAAIPDPRRKKRKARR